MDLLTRVYFKVLDFIQERPATATLVVFITWILVHNLLDTSNYYHGGR